MSRVPRYKAEQQMFLCGRHEFVVLATTDGDVTCRGTPGHRVPGCEDCDKAVVDAMVYAGIES